LELKISIEEKKWVLNIGEHSNPRGEVMSAAGG
jgi:hypothetical protein